MQKGRFGWFLLSIALGVVAGLVYGWAVHPLHSSNSTADQLRSDYQTDYVLMVAEVYKTEKDPALAAHRLALLGDQPPMRMVQEAILAAGTLGYASADLDVLAGLAQGLNAPQPAAPTAAATATAAVGAP